MLATIGTKNTAIRRTGVNMEKYTFWIRWDSGVTSQTGLSKRQAVIRYNKFGKTNDAVKAHSYGWKLER